MTMKILRNLITPFYARRTETAKRRTAATKDNVAAINRNRSAAADVKALRKAGVLK